MEARAASRILIVAGEASGDRHAARLVEALRAHGSLEACGVTGPALERSGVRRIADASELSVVGFTGVIARLPRILAVEGAVERAAREFRPQVAVLVDSPGFNFRIGPRLHRLGIRTFYYIAPQVWAWHAERAHQMSRWVDRLAVVFPFEEELFRRAGVDARFVGHPLIDDLSPEQDGATLRSRLGLAPATRLIGLLPGSRRGEMRAHLPVMVETARALCAGRPGLVALVAVAAGLEDLVPPRLRDAGSPVRAVSGATRSIQAAAECCIVASGTATLETALFETPLVVVYRTSRINYAIARRVVRLERIGLPNIIAQTDVAPERVQDAFTRAELEPILAGWLDDPSARAKQQALLSQVRARLGGPGAGARAAAWLAELLA